MLKLNYFALILDNLLITVDHYESLRVHFLKQGTFVIQKELVLCDLFLHSLLQLVQFFVLDFFCFLSDDLVDLRLNLCNLIFFVFYLHDNILNLLQAPRLVDLRDFGL